MLPAQQVSALLSISLGALVFGSGCWSSTVVLTCANFIRVSNFDIDCQLLLRVRKLACSLRPPIIDDGGVSLVVLLVLLVVDTRLDICCCILETDCANDCRSLLSVLVVIWLTVERSSLPLFSRHRL